MSKLRRAYYTPLLFLILLIGALLIAFRPLAVKAQQPSSKEGCRAVSKLEYDIAKREYVLISRGGRYVQTGHFWRSHYWWCHV
jgi:hypothetical protein